MLWRIDFGKGVAHIVEPARYFPDICELNAQSYAQLERRR